MTRKTEVLNGLIDTCIEQAPSGVWYVTPMWRDSPILYGYDGDYAELLEVLKLTVDKKNAIDNQVNPILQWLYKLMTETVDPTLDEFETDLMHGALEYLNGKKNEGWDFAKK